MYFWGVHFLSIFPSQPGRGATLPCPGRWEGKVLRAARGGGSRRHKLKVSISRRQEGVTGPPSLLQAPTSQPRGRVSRRSGYWYRHGPACHGEELKSQDFGFSTGFSSILKWLSYFSSVLFSSWIQKQAVQMESEIMYGYMPIFSWQFPIQKYLENGPSERGVGRNISRGVVLNMIFQKC